MDSEGREGGRDRREQLWLLADMMPQLVWTTDAFGYHDYYNRRWYEYTGLTLEQTAGEGWQQAFHPDDMVETNRRWRRSLATGEPYETEYRCRRHDGAWRWFLGRAMPIRDDGGRVVRWFGTCTDIDDQKRAEQTQIRRTRQALLVGEVGEILTRSDSLATMLQGAAQGLVRHLDATFVRLWTTDPRGGDLALGASAGEDHLAGAPPPSPEGIRYPLRVEGRDVGVLEIFVREPLTDDAHETLTAVADLVALGVERKTANLALLEQAERLETLNRVGKQLAGELEVDTLVQIVTDAATVVTRAQFGAFFYNVVREDGEKYQLYTLSGVPRAAFEKFPMPRNTKVFAPTFNGEAVVRLDDVTADPRYGQSAPHFGMPKGHLPVRSYLAVPVLSRTGSVIGGLFFGHERVGVFTDASEQVAVGLAAQAAIAMDNARLFQEARRLIGALEKNNEQLDQFAYSASHDLKAPLRGIANLSEWIEEDLQGRMTPEAAHHMSLLRSRVKRLEGLIDGILHFSRAARVSGEPETVDLKDLLEETVELLAVPPACRVEIASMPTLSTERAPLQQVFMNLVSNALKYNPKAAPVVRLGARELDHAWEFFVQDDGPGLAGRDHERIWGLFQTLQSKDKNESTGIGLAVVRRIVESKGGRAWVESDVGVGATFKFTWPKERR